MRTLKAQLTSISNATKAVWTGLDTMRSNILARVERPKRRSAPRADRTICAPDTMPTPNGTKGL